MSRRSAALAGAVLAYVSIGLVFVRNLGLVPLFVSAIGVEEYGAWLATGAVLVQLTSIDFGLLGVLGQRVALAYGAADRVQIERLVGSGLLVSGGLALLLAVVAAAFAPLATLAVDIGGDQGRRVTQCIWIACGANALQVTAFGIGEVLKNMQRPVHPGAHANLGEVLSLVLTVWLIQLGWGLYAIPLGLVLRGAWMLAGNALSFLWIVVRELRIRPAWNTSLLRSLLRDSTYLFGTQLALRVRAYLDPLLVGMTLGPTAAGIFALTLRSQQMVQLLAVQFGAALLPGLSHLFGQQNERRLREMVAARYKMTTWIAAIGLGGCIAFNPAFMHLWVGDEMYAGNPVNILFALATLVFMVSGCAYDALFARGEFRVIVRLVWLDALGRLPLLMVGLAVWGLLGAGVATLLASVALVAIPMTISLVRRQPAPPGELRLLARHVGVVAVAVTGLSLGVLAWSPPTGSWLELAALGAAFVVVTALLAAAVDPAFVRFLRRRGTGSPLTGVGGP